MKYIWICCRDICDSIGKRSLIGRKILFIVVMPEGVATFLFSTKIYVNNLVNYNKALDNRNKLLKDIYNTHNTKKGYTDV